MRRGSAGAFSCLLVSLLVCGAQAQSVPAPNTASAELAGSSGVPDSQSADPQKNTTVPQTPQEELKWRLEATGYFAHVTNNYGNWSGGSAWLTYVGNKVFQPNIFMATQTRPEGSQQAYGMGTYVHFSKLVYANVGVSSAPNHGAVLFPNFRFDITGFAKPPKLPGLITTLGYSSYRMGGNNSAAVSLGGIYYYRRAILDGAISFHRSDPGDLHSKSGRLSIMTGRQGSYWIGVGAQGGDVKYQLLGIVPINVQNPGYGISAFYQKWIQKRWGITERYYFTNLLSQYKSHSVSATLFYEF